MKARSIRKNYLYNVTVQVITLLAPLIVIPYVSRVLMPEGVGISSYATSITSYFVLFAALGTTTYGQRTIGYMQNDAEKRSRAFWEIFLLRVITTSITSVAYGFFVLFADVDKTIYAILLLNIINVIVDILWFFQGVEDFAKVSLFNIIVRILYVTLIFIFVKTADDLNIYIFLTAGSTVFANLLSWMLLPKYLCKVKNIKPFRDIKTVLQLFIPTVAIQVYAVLDKSMIGWITGSYDENGFYDRAECIAKMVTSIVTSMATVMLPRISSEVEKGNTDSVKKYIGKSYKFVWCLGIPIMFGLISIADFFIPIFLGESFMPSVIMLRIFSFLAVLIGLSNVTGMQYLIPTKKQNVLTLTVIVGAVVNFVMNMILIRLIGALGACIASVVAEFCVTSVGFIYILKTKQLSLKSVFLSSWKNWVAGIVMLITVFVVKYFLPITIWALIVLIIIGISVYGCILLIERDEIVFDIISRIKSKIRHEKDMTDKAEKNQNIENQESLCQDKVDDKSDDSFI